MDVKQIPISQIRRAEEQLREVNIEAEPFQDLKRDIAKRGVMSNIVVILKKDENTGEQYYLLNDGNHRFTAVEMLYKETGDKKFETILAGIVDGASIDDVEFYARQLTMNATQVETKPSEFTKAIKRMLQMTPEATMKELASRFSKSETWLKNRLSLASLPDEVQKEIDAKTIPVMNAIQLARLNSDDMPLFIDRARSESSTDFAAHVNTRIQEQRAAAKTGKTAGEEKFVPVAKLRPAAELKTELETLAKAKSYAGTNLRPEQATEDYIKWLFRLDAASVKAQQDDWDMEQAKIKEKKAKKAADNLAKLGVNPADVAAMAQAAPKQ